MTFVSSRLYETPEQETARLAESPEGSRNHALSKLPVRITEYLQDKVVQLPWTREGEQEYLIVVVPLEYSPVARGESLALPIKVHVGWWSCAVVYSTTKVYPAGGWRISVPEAELVRGKLLDLRGVTYPGGQI